jgi:hypothetical protein
MKNQTKNSKQLESFTKYCLENPDQRFFQAFSNWCVLNKKADGVYFADHKKSVFPDEGTYGIVNLRDIFYEK